MHKVTVQNPGPVDSLLSDAQGRFVFHAAADSGVVYLVSAKWSGIEYFATPFVVHVDSPTPASIVVVADTSSTAPVNLVARHLIVSLPDAGGMRDVVDLSVLNNASALTRVAAKALQPTWRTHLPRFAVNVRAGNSDFSAESIRFIGDVVALFAAISARPARHRGRLRFPADQLVRTPTATPKCRTPAGAGTRECGCAVRSLAPTPSSTASRMRAGRAG